MIPAEAFAPIIEELTRKPIPINKQRTTSGTGRSQAFGLTNRRCMAPDYSKQCYLRPYLYKTLIDFADKYVSIPYNAITLNQNYKALPHKDKGNKGISYLVAFGDFEGGTLTIHEGDLSGNHDIRHKPVITDFSKVLHSVNDFTGDRYSLVFYILKKDTTDLPKGSIRLEEDGKYYFFRGEEKITKDNKIPHINTGRMLKKKSN